MVKCEDCGKLIDIEEEHRDFMDYIESEYPDEDRFSLSDPEPFGVPLCCSCAIDTYEEPLLEDDFKYNVKDEVPDASDEWMFDD